jgi:hypothetical protein
MSFPLFFAPHDPSRELFRPVGTLTYDSEFGRGGGGANTNPMR